MIKKIVDINDPVLRKKAKLVRKIDKKVLELIVDMKDTLKAQDDPEGVGLAAPQIGKSFQIFLIDHEGHEKVVINPKLIKIGTIKKTKSEDKNPLEGCLSLPHYYGPVARANRITISFLNEKGKVLVEEFKGFLAHIVQHELDHLEGSIFIDRILEQNSPLFKFTGNEWEEVDL